MKQVVLFACVLISCLNGVSQPLNFNENQKAHRKYWFYKTHFVNDFIKIGDKQGDCIAFPERNFNYDDGNGNNYSMFHAVVGRNQIDIYQRLL